MIGKRIFRPGYIFLICLICISLAASAQVPELVTEKRREALLELSDSLQILSEQKLEEAREVARQKGWPLHFSDPDGVFYAIQKIDNGLPYYYRTHNRGGAETSGADKLYHGAERRLFLSGKDVIAGVWDGGRIFNTHMEFNGRVTNKNPDANLSTHATHVAGTIIASGNNSAARGMAYEGHVYGYDWDNDINEMAHEAAAGLLLSNHSYGYALGWERDSEGNWEWRGPDDADEDYRFGFYMNVSRNIDVISYNAPYYQIVWSAGNHRNDIGNGSRPPDGPYDCMGPHAVAKNVLAIGAVQGISGGYEEPSDVRMTAFSSWGPADDGRIKPDLVAKGQSLTSTVLNNEYGVSSGTSMSAPVVTGSLMLIQQLYYELSDGNYLRAASLKGLAIHTANEAGDTIGPDYSYGWGLLDVSRMADFLLYHDDHHFVFKEEVMNNDDTLYYHFQSDGENPIKATMTWTDYPGTSPEPQINPRNPMLVNDLDMRVISAEGDTLFPWILDVENPEKHATTGDNRVDNVEQVYVAMPTPGEYQLMITHKDTLRTGSQHFSLFIQSTALPEPRQNLYWVGGTGNWDDGSNWALKSGGEPAGVVPGADDHVIIDSVSFNGNNERILLTTDAACYTLTFKEGAEGMIDVNGQRLDIMNSLYAEKNPFPVSTPGMLSFTGNRKDGRIIWPGQEQQQDLILTFDNPDGRWKIHSDIRLKEIRLISGRLIMEDLDVVVDKITVSDNDSEKTLSLAGSHVSGLLGLYMPEGQVHFNGLGATLVFDHASLSGENKAFLDAGDIELHMLVNQKGLEVTGKLVVNDLINYGALSLNHDFEAMHTVFGPGAGFFIAPGQTFYIKDEISGTGGVGSPVAFSGGEGSRIYGQEIRLFCFDYVQVSNLSAAGQAYFNAGPNGSLTNADGWYKTVCNEILFADFEVESPCVYSWTTFRDRSSGSPQQRAWEIGDDITSSEEAPIYTFTETGNLPVSLTVSKQGEESHTNTSNVMIHENPFAEPSIVISVTRDIYTVSTVAPYYQWFRNGNPIEGATARSYYNTEMIHGIYTVLISNDFCNRPSVNEVNTDVSEKFPARNGLRIFPNPASDRIQIESEAPIKSIEVMNILGRTVHATKGDGLYHSLAVSGLQNGIYLLRVITEEIIYYEKVQIQR